MAYSLYVLTALNTIDGAAVLSIGGSTKSMRGCALRENAHVLGGLPSPRHQPAVRND